MKYAVITAILALGLAGCNLNGLTFDTSALPSLNIDEANCNNCNVNLNNADAEPAFPEPQASYVELIGGKGSGRGVGPPRADSGGRPGLADHFFIGTSGVIVPGADAFERMNAGKESRPSNEEELEDTGIFYYANEANDEFQMEVWGPIVDWRNLPSGDVHYRGNDLFIREPDGTAGLKGTVTGKANFDDMMIDVNLEAPNLKIVARNMAITSSDFEFHSLGLGRDDVVEVYLNRYGWEYTSNDWDFKTITTNKKGPGLSSEDYQRHYKVSLSGFFNGAGEAISGDFRLFDGTAGVFTADKVETESGQDQTNSPGS